MSQTKAQLIDTLVASLLPASDSSVDLGSNAVRFANIYGDTLYGSGANLTGLNIVTDTSPQLGGNLDVNTKNILFGDSASASDDRLILGAGSDLQIFHNGTNSLINNTLTTGSLFIKGDSIQITSFTNTEKYITGVKDGATELYFDNSIKLNTNAVGIRFYGSLRGVDNEKLELGSSQDLQLFHNGTNSHINSQTGELDIRSDDFHLRNQANNENMIVATLNGSVDLYYDNSKKLETTSTGVAITGGLTTSGSSTFNEDVFFIGASSKTITFDQSEGHIRYLDNAKAQFGTQGDLNIYHDASNSYIVDQGTGSLIIQGSQTLIRNTSGHVQIKANDDLVEIYYDNAKKFETESAGTRTTGRHLIKGHSNIDNQGSPLLFLQDSTNTNTKAVFLLEDDYTTGRGALAINVGESGVTNDRDLMLQRAGGKVGVRCTPTESFEVSGTSKFNGAIRLGDSNELRLGTGDDFKMYHDGTNSLTFFDAQVGGVRFRTDIGNSARSNIILGTGVNLYYDNNLKFATTADGVAVSNTPNNRGLDLNGAGNNTCIRFMSTGSSPGHAYRINFHSVSNNIFNSPCIGFDKTDTSGNFDSHIGAISDDGFHLGDNKKLHLGGTGANGDLQIVHDGSNSRISDNGTGNLILDGNNVIIQSNDNSETIAKFITNGAVELYYDNSKKLNTHPNGIFVQGIYPMADNTYNIGSSTQRFINIYATSGTVNTSDKNVKNTIVNSDLGLDFINKLNPVSYKWNEDDGKTHYGLIAQDVEETLTSIGKTISDFGGLYKKDTSPMGLGYSELIAPLIKAIQELSAEVAALKAA